MGLVAKIGNGVRNMRTSTKVEDRLGLSSTSIHARKLTHVKNILQSISFVRKLTGEIIGSVFLLKSQAMMKKTDREVGSIEEKYFFG